MSNHTVSRRLALKTGLSAAGLAVAASCGSEQQPQTTGIQRTSTETGPGREPFWAPGPDRNLVRDLTPGTTPIRLSGNLNGDANTDFIAQIETLAKNGFHAANATAEPWLDLPDSRIAEVRAALAEHDIVVFEVGGYRNLLHPDEAQRQENIKYVASCLKAAEKIGCPMVGTISGSRNPIGNQWADNYAVHPDNWTRETWNILLDSIRSILTATSGLKAVIGIEAQVTTNQDTPLAHRRLLDDIGSDRLKVNLDPTNMVHLYNHFHTTNLINECFDLLGEDIVGCHAKDSFVVPHEQTVHIQEVCPGRGRLDYETFLVRLSRMKWSRALLPEHIPNDQYDEAYAYIRKVAAQVGVKICGEG